MSWYLWLMLVALLVLPVLLRWAGDEPRGDDPPDISAACEPDRDEVRLAA